MPLHKRKEDTSRFRNVKENFTDDEKKWTYFGIGAVVLVGVAALIIFYKRKQSASAAFRGMKFY
jgi:LPXTG-motif cell wall-anchored protein